jgi:uncharacterized protein
VYRRHAEPRIREALTDTRVVAISGPRQSGKTTLARAIAGTDYTYVTLDDPAILSAARNDPTGLIARLDRAVIDEIQRAPELVLSIKKSVDEDPRPGRFLITGSADLLAMPKAAESLAGRIEVVPLLPLSLCERTDAIRQLSSTASCVARHRKHKRRPSALSKPSLQADIPKHLPGP